MNGVTYTCDGCGRSGAADARRGSYECPACRWRGPLQPDSARIGEAIRVLSADARHRREENDRRALEDAQRVVDRSIRRRRERASRRGSRAIRRAERKASEALGYDVEYVWNDARFVEFRRAGVGTPVVLGGNWPQQLGLNHPRR